MSRKMPRSRGPSLTDPHCTIPPPFGGAGDTNGETMPILGAAIRAELADALGLRAIHLELRTELRAITRELRALRTALGRRGQSRRSSRGRRTSPRGRVLRLSPQRRAALKLQGQYMGYLRG